MPLSKGGGGKGLHSHRTDCVVVCCEVLLFLVHILQDISVLEKKLIEHEDAGRQPLLIVAYAGQLHYLCIYMYIQYNIALLIVLLS